MGDPIACDMLFVVAAGDPAAFDHPATFAWLRRLASEGCTIAGVSGGPFVLARAGLLDRYRATIHWEHEAALRDALSAAGDRIEPVRDRPPPGDLRGAAPPGWTWRSR